MSKVSFEVHESHEPLWSDKEWRYAFLMGGRGNGRSGTASRYAVSQLLGKEYTRGAIMRAVHSDIRSSCWAEIMGRLDEQGIRDAFKVNDGEMLIERGTNSLRAMGFKSSSGSLTARLKSLADFNFLWIEEAEEIGEKEFRKLDDSIRTLKGRHRIIFTLNTPPKEHWIIKRWFDLKAHPEAKDFYIPHLKKDATDAIFIAGTYRENAANIAPASIRQYQSYKQSSPYYYWNGIEGLVPETVHGLIYPYWREIPEVPFGARLMGRGLDFGWSPDPTAELAMYYYDGGYIFDEEIYQTEMRIRDVGETIKAQKEPKKLIVGDCADPRSIAELQLEGLNIIACEKGADSVMHGINLLQGVPVSYTARSKNLKRELGLYAIKEDKNGEPIPGEVSGPDHALDAARYIASYVIPMQRRSDIANTRAVVVRRPKANPAR